MASKSAFIAMEIASSASPRRRPGAPSEHKVQFAFIGPVQQQLSTLGLLKNRPHPFAANVPDARAGLWQTGIQPLWVKRSRILGRPGRPEYFPR